MKTPQERFESYLHKWAEREGVDIKQLIELAIVKEYKNWIIEECKDYDYSREKELLEAVQEIDTEDCCVGKGIAKY